MITFLIYKILGSQSQAPSLRIKKAGLTIIHPHKQDTYNFRSIIIKVLNL
jgi:hypothetical protein